MKASPRSSGEGRGLARQREPYEVRRACAKETLDGLNLIRHSRGPLQLFYYQPTRSLDPKGPRPPEPEELRQAAAQNPIDPRVRQNLALVVGLQGRFAEAEDIARSDLPPDQAAANVAYLRQMLAQQGDVKTSPRLRALASADRT